MLNLIATTTFGLEAVVKREAIRLGFKNIKVSDGRVEFEGDETSIVKANLWFRCADRVLIKMGEFKVFSFEELFEKTKALPWDKWIDKDGEFTVTGKSIKSQLFSVPDCQAIVKKAIVEKMKQKYEDVEWFEETGAKYTVQVAILKDVATLTIDTSGSGLHKRGYRENAVEAPLKETLAAAMVELSYWRKNRILLDPFCGSGTIAIEAALIAKNIAPGLNRHFAAEEWSQIDKKDWDIQRQEAYNCIDNEIVPQIYASDIDAQAVEIAVSNAKKAGVDKYINFSVQDFEDININQKYGVVICNPPYGERMGDAKQIQSIAQKLGKIFAKETTWSVYVITSDENFEKFYGKKADNKRKLFNGRIKTDYYQYCGERPPRQ